MCIDRSVGVHTYYICIDAPASPAGSWLSPGLGRLCRWLLSFAAGGTRRSLPKMAFWSAPEPGPRAGGSLGALVFIVAVDK